MDDSTEKHFLAWANAGRCPIEVYDEPEESWKKMLEYLSQFDADDLDYQLSLGWSVLWGRTEML